MSNKLNSITPVFIYRLGSLGDTLVSLPCFHKIAEVFPDQPKLVLTNFPISTKAAPLEVILRPAGLIDGVIEYPVGLRSISALFRLRRSIRQTGSDTLIYLAASRGRWSVFRDFLFFRFCGFSHFFGLPTTEDLRENRIDPFDGTCEPEAERLARTLARVGPINLQHSRYWDLRLTDGEKQVATGLLKTLGGKPFFAVNMGGKDACKDWGERNWNALAKLLASEMPTMAMVIVGAAEDSARAADLLVCWPMVGVNVCGMVSPRESAAILARATFFVGHDSGPLHLAATMQVPCVGLFGDNNLPRKWHPYGPRHHVLHDMRGVLAIDVPQVFHAILSMTNALNQYQKPQVTDVH